MTEVCKRVGITDTGSSVVPVAQHCRLVGHWSHSWLLCCVSHWSAITCFPSFLPSTVRGPYVKGCASAAPSGELAPDRYPEHTLSLVYPTSFITYGCGTLLWELALEPDRREHKSCACESTCRQRQGVRQTQLCRHCGCGGRAH